MPEYEYICLNCKRNFNVHMAYAEYGRKKIICSYCASDQTQRKISRLRIKRSESNRLAELPDPDSLEGLEKDPRSFAKMIRSASAESGEELGPEFDEVVDRLESGQTPDEIEKAVPGLEEGTTPSDLGDDSY